MQYHLEDSAGYLIYRVGRLLRFRAGQYFRDRNLDLSPEQWGLLLQIAEKGEPTMSDLVDTTVGDHPNVTRLVNGLVRMGYVERMQNPEDKRSHLISVTADGTSLIEDVFPDVTEAKAVFFEGLDQREVTALVKSLQVVLGNLVE